MTDQSILIPRLTILTQGSRSLIEGKVRDSMKAASVRHLPVMAKEDSSFEDSADRVAFPPPCPVDQVFTKRVLTRHTRCSVCYVL